MSEQINLYKMFFSLKTYFPNKIVTSIDDCFISVIMLILLSGILFAIKRALSERVSSMLKTTMYGFVFILERLTSVFAEACG